VAEVHIHINPIVFAVMEAEPKAMDVARSIDDGTTVRMLLDDLANQLGPGFVEKIYNPGTGEMNRYFLLVKNNQVLNREEAGTLDLVMQDGDTLGLIPMYVGG
jgi:molybdopterin converting factor small subunit